MESANIDSMCRCCAAEGMFKDIKTSYHWMGEEEVYGDMLRECFDVKLSSVEEGGICEVCITQLRNAANFKKQVLHTEKKFKRHLETRRFKPTEVKEEVSADNDNSSDDDRGADSEDDEDYVPEFEIPIKTETPEESKSRKRSAKATTSRAKKSRVDDDKSDIFNYHPIKTELDDSEASLVKLEANHDPTQTKLRRQIKAKQSLKPVETNKTISLKPAAKSTSAISEIKIELPPVKKIKVKSTDRPTRRLVIKRKKIAPPSVLPSCELNKHRHNIKTILQCSNATPIRCHFFGSGFFCSFCKSSFIKAADLKTHTIHEHGEEAIKKFMHGFRLVKFVVKLDITSLMCNICSMSINTLESLIEHLDSIHQKGLHTDIKNRIACFKFDGEAMKCYVCSAEYQSFKCLFAHMNNHIANFICDECGAGFITKHQIYHHHCFEHKAPAVGSSSAIQRIQIKPSTERPLFKKIKVKTTERPTRSTKTELSQDCELVTKFTPQSLLPQGFELDKHRYNIGTILQCSNATPIRSHYVGSGFVCSFCKSSFIKAADLKTHTIHEHGEETRNKLLHDMHLYTFVIKLDITSLMCNICSMSMNTLESLIEHLNSIHQKGLHTDVKNHIACFKFDGEAMKCYVCSAEYQSFKFLYAHMNKHITNYICNECGAGFINKKQLHTHSGAHKVGAHKCDLCDKVFNSSLKMRSHRRHSHTVRAVYTCHQCPERFTTLTAKHKHVEKAHGIVLASLKCDACDRTFKTNDGLRIHRKKDHLMERNHVCQICDRGFYDAAVLRKHQVTHTGARDFKCELCSKTYSRRHGLMEHMRSHTNDRRFKCSYCGMTFLQKCSLKGHLRSRHDAELE